MGVEQEPKEPGDVETAMDEASGDCKKLAGRLTTGWAKRESIKEAIADNKIGDLVITGPAGTGKTYTAVEGIVDGLLNGSITKVFVSRTNV